MPRKSADAWLAEVDGAFRIVPADDEQEAIAEVEAMRADAKRSLRLIRRLEFEFALDPQPGGDVAVDVLDALFSRADHPHYDVDWQAYYERWRSFGPTTEQWLYDPAGTIVLQALRHDDDALMLAAIETHRAYAERLEFRDDDSVALRPKPSGDRKYLYLRSEYLLRAAGSGRFLTDDQVRQIGSHVTGGWGELPYLRSDQVITERDVATGLAAQVWAYAILGEEEFAIRAQTMLASIDLWQRNPRDPFARDGSLRHSIALHEGLRYPGSAIAPDRGFSPWMTALVGAELYHASLVLPDTAALARSIARGLASAITEHARLPLDMITSDGSEVARRATAVTHQARNRYEPYLCTSLVKPNLWPAEDYLRWFTDLHTPDGWLLMAFAGNMDGVAHVERWFAAGAEKSTRTVGPKHKRGFGWAFKNGTAPMLLTGDTP